MKNINIILVTGGAGFIGSHLCEYLIGMGFTVICADNFNSFYDPAIKLNNISALHSNDRFRLIKTDIRNRNEMHAIFKSCRPDLVIHLAAMPGVRPSIENPALYLDVNINGTLNLLETMQIHKVTNMVFASSSSVYGNNLKIPFSESDPVEDQISPYAYSKRAGELLCKLYHNLYGFNVSCLRFFTVYGPRQRPDLAINRFADKIMANEVIEVYGTGNTCRDYTFISDIINGIYLSAIHLNGFNIFNLGESQTISLNHMIDTLENALGKKAIRKYLPLQQGDVDNTYADIGKARTILGYNPSFDFTTGIELFVRWKTMQTAASHSSSEERYGKTNILKTLPGDISFSRA